MTAEIVSNSRIDPIQIPAIHIDSLSETILSDDQGSTRNDRYYCHFVALLLLVVDSSVRKRWKVFFVHFRFVSSTRFIHRFFCTLIDSIFHRMFFDFSSTLFSIVSSLFLDTPRNSDSLNPRVSLAIKRKKFFLFSCLKSEKLKAKPSSVFLCDSLIFQLTTLTFSVEKHLRIRKFFLSTDPHVFYFVWKIISIFNSVHFFTAVERYRKTNNFFCMIDRPIEQKRTSRFSCCFQLRMRFLMFIHCCEIDPTGV